MLTDHERPFCASWHYFWRWKYTHTHRTWALQYELNCVAWVSARCSFQSGIHWNRTWKSRWSELNCDAWVSEQCLFQSGIHWNRTWNRGVIQFMSLEVRYVNYFKRTTLKIAVQVWFSLCRLRFDEWVVSNEHPVKSQCNNGALWLTLCLLRLLALMASNVQLSKSQTNVITPASFVVDRARFCDMKNRSAIMERYDWLCAF